MVRTVFGDLFFCFFVFIGFLIEYRLLFYFFFRSLQNWLEVVTWNFILDIVSPDFDYLFDVDI